MRSAGRSAEPKSVNCHQFFPLLQQAAQDCEITGMSLFVVSERRLQNHRRPAQAGLGEKAAKRLEAEAALAEIGVPVLARTQRSGRIVQVDAGPRHF